MAHLFVELGVVLAAVYAAGQALEGVGQPGFLGELAAGVLVGPQVLGLVTVDGVVHVFATIGAASLFFHVGYEKVDLGGLVAVGRPAVSIAAFGMAVPFASGLLVGWAFGYGPVGTLFLAVALSITSIAVTVRTLAHLGQAETTYANKLVAAAVVDDVTGMIAFAVLLIAVAGTVALLAAKVVGFFTLAGLVHWFLADPLFERVVPAERAGGPFLVLGALLALFAAAAEFADLHATIGAFVAGLIAGHGERTADLARGSGVAVITYGVFAPVFFAAVGMRLEFAAFAGLDPLLVVLVAAGVLAKVGGGYMGNRVVGGSVAESVAVGVGMVPRTGVELVIVSVALSRGLVDQRLYAAFVLLVVVSVVFTPALLERLSERTPAAFTAAG